MRIRIQAVELTKNNKSAADQKLDSTQSESEKDLKYAEIADVSETPKNRTLGTKNKKSAT